MKLYKEGDNLRITWHWPPETEQAYMYVNGEKKLYTLQEYKKRGGYITKRTTGKTTYEVLGNKLTYIQQTNIKADIQKNNYFYTLTLTAENDIPPSAICYATNSQTYTLGEKLEANKPLTRIIQTDEEITLFINEDNHELYNLEILNNSPKIHKLLTLLNVGL